VLNSWTLLSVATNGAEDESLGRLWPRQGAMQITQGSDGMAFTLIRSNE
jgi:hypothetical protein